MYAYGHQISKLKQKVNGDIHSIQPVGIKLAFFSGTQAGFFIHLFWIVFNQF
jgi:hypothetical protein